MLGAALGAEGLRAVVALPAGRAHAHARLLADAVRAPLRAERLLARRARPAGRAVAHARHGAGTARPARAGGLGADVAAPPRLASDLTAQPGVPLVAKALAERADAAGGAAVPRRDHLAAGELHRV